MLLDARRDGTVKNAIFVGRWFRRNLLIHLRLWRWAMKATKAAVKCVINVFARLGNALAVQAAVHTTAAPAGADRISVHIYTIRSCGSRDVFEPLK
jgi:hypothetical protein